jgi:hypothetical protein
MFTRAPGALLWQVVTVSPSSSIILPSPDRLTAS